jgi:hypothetical protein
MESVVKYKDPGDGSIKFAFGEIVEESKKGIVIDDGKNYLLIHRINILKILFLIFSHHNSE